MIQVIKLNPSHALRCVNDKDHTPTMAPPAETEVIVGSKSLPLCGSCTTDLVDRIMESLS